MRIEIWTTASGTRLAVPDYRGEAMVIIERANPMSRRLLDGTHWVPGNGRTIGRARRMTLRALRRLDDSIRAVGQLQREYPHTCGEDFCEDCGDCMYCHYDDPCGGEPGKPHRFVAPETPKQDEVSR